MDWESLEDNGFSEILGKGLLRRGAGDRSMGSFDVGPQWVCCHRDEGLTTVVVEREDCADNTVHRVHRSDGGAPSGLGTETDLSAAHGVDPVRPEFRVERVDLFGRQRVGEPGSKHVITRQQVSRRGEEHLTLAAALVGRDKVFLILWGLESDGRAGEGARERVGHGHTVGRHG